MAEIPMFAHCVSHRLIQFKSFTRGIEDKLPSRSLLFDLETEKAMDVVRNNLRIWSPGATYPTTP
jgi:hypothetical protein